MSISFSADKLVVVGLGYVGLPLAARLAVFYDVVGFDVDASRIEELKSGKDRTGELERAVLRDTTIRFSSDPAAMADAAIYFVTVPTPVTTSNGPDLSHLVSACRSIGSGLSKNSIVVFESTVYPGVTEGICRETLEDVSGLRCGEDFFLGYSPERVSPGDREHTVDKIAKVVAGQTAEVSEHLAAVYRKVTSGDVFIARDIRTAEAAKVIENTQRDINIAFVNELALIFDKLGISTHDVLAAAGTKWNFLPFTPGLVGGHCISVDPYYLCHLARESGYEPELLLAGRRINDSMSRFVARRVHSLLDETTSSILFLGVTFKENVPDLRNSKAIEVVNALTDLGHRVHAHDPCADPVEVQREFNIDLLSELSGSAPYDCVIAGVQHDVYTKLPGKRIMSLMPNGGLVCDLKGMWRHISLAGDYRRWEL